MMMVTYMSMAKQVQEDQMRLKKAFASMVISDSEGESSSQSSA